jgi:uncharacterized membrane protein
MMGLLAPVQVGICHVTFKLLRGEPTTGSDIFFGFKRFGQAFMFGLVYYIAVALGTYCCYIPGFVIGGLWMLAIPTLADREVGAIEAFGISWQLMRPFWILGAVMYFLISFMSGLGVLACCVGIVLSYPLLALIPALIYRDLARPFWFDPNAGMPPVAPPAPEHMD